MAIGRTRAPRRNPGRARICRIRVRSGYLCRTRVAPVIGATLTRCDARQASINLRMRVPSLSISAVYPRTLEGVLSLTLVSRPSSVRRSQMPNTSGDWPNGAPVHRNTRRVEDA
ncbi:nodulation protein NodY [Bradyrhizobium elkanii USDA 61]|nr:nodulation protein NodY [Bradyrhizobium elkanii USDA 61]